MASYITVQICCSNEPYHTMLVQSSTTPSMLYTVLVDMPGDAPEEWVCSCPSFQFRGHCKHLAMVSPCLWKEYEGPEIQKVARICPRCDGPTTTDLIEE